MWVFLNDAFLSIVAHRDDPASLLVRARNEGDIRRVFPAAVEHHTPSYDYPYRAVVPRDDVAAALAQATRSIGYTNFKNSVSEHGRRTAYFAVWSAMADHQDWSKRARRGRPGATPSGR